VVLIVSLASFSRAPLFSHGRMSDFDEDAMIIEHSSCKLRVRGKGCAVVEGKLEMDERRCLAGSLFEEAAAWMTPRPRIYRHDIKFMRKAGGKLGCVVKLINKSDENYSKKFPKGWSLILLALP